MNVRFRPYSSTDQQFCIGMFDANCPQFFSPNERQAYQKFLANAPPSYEVCEVDGQVRGAFGVIRGNEGGKHLRWVLLDPQTRGLGIGRKVMEHAIQVSIDSNTSTLNIAASHISAPFFGNFGATATSITQDGWGPGMHRVDMLLSLPA